MSDSVEEIMSHGTGIVKFTTTKVLYSPSRGGVSSYSILEPMITYALMDCSAQSFSQNDVHAMFEYIEDKPPFKEMENISLFFPGGIGDVVCLKACFELLDKDRTIYPNLKTINMYSSKDDAPIMLDGAIKNIDITIMNYPPHYNMIKNSDAVVGFGPLQRRSMQYELSDTMASILRMPYPKTHPTLIPNKNYVEALRNHLQDSNRKKIGLQIYSSAHYRSIPPNMAMWIAMELVEMGYEIYIIGITGQRVKLFDKGMFCELPEHIYDMSGLLYGLDEFIAFTELMDGFITPDTSMVHMAGSMLKPTVALFGPSSGKWRTTYYPTVVSMSYDAPCAPCYNLDRPTDCGKQWCDAITKLEPREIAKMLHGLM